ncbi:hypothetical protein FDI40_gp367 [Agrobacterium phage Atu_ph07]|uniref:Uncharacterized protein n=1 Tax=Agrobacterium phage Atu_ph07 TaxID=2024264 RepID=A0A2L0V030_9CAUD|nr:hypothetical protein FDI40_gp367 [Agrobacterium phage Atu_ph07]AUZ95126.1 hypothetical protein [Agrobacterium phage Atu_ph07]
MGYKLYSPSENVFYMPGISTPLRPEKYVIGSSKDSVILALCNAVANKDEYPAFPSDLCVLNEVTDKTEKIRWDLINLFFKYPEVRYNKDIIDFFKKVDDVGAGLVVYANSFFNPSIEPTFTAKWSSVTYYFYDELSIGLQVAMVNSEGIIRFVDVEQCKGKLP